MQAHILIAEADPTIRKHLECLLRDLGHACAGVSSLPAALTELQGQPYDIVIVDLDLARGGQGDFTAQLLGARRSVRLIGLDSAGGHDSHGALHRNLDAVIPKPFLAEPLLATLPALLTARGGAQAEA